MSTPCNSLNAQFIKVSQLGSYPASGSAIKDADKLMIIENTGGSYFSRNSSLSDLRKYILGSGTSGFPTLGSTKSYYTGTDALTLNNYVLGNLSLTFAHGFASVPSIVRTVLLCISGDGYYNINDEIDVSGCYNENSRPFCSVSSNSTNVRVLIPSFTYIKTYTWNGGTNGLVNLSSGAWSIKVYAWK
jgi:hypothetical protein